MFHSDVIEAQVIITHPRTVICNPCYKNLYQAIYWTLEEMLMNKKILGFKFIYQKIPITINDITKIKPIKLNSKQLLNIYEQHLKNIETKDKKSDETENKKVIGHI